MNFKAIISRIFLLFFVFSISLLILCLFSERAAYILNYTLAFQLRRLFASSFSLFDFSLFEILLSSLPLLVFLAVCYINRAERAQDIKGRFILLLSLFSLLPSSYVFIIAIPNLAPSPLTFDPAGIEDADFVRSAKILADGVNELADKNEICASYEFLADVMTESYSTVFDEYGYPNTALPRAKPIRLSRALSYTGALALYTGEININTEIPPYMTPFTLAHEYAHYLGIGGEGDANLFAFICCERTDDESIRYSARLTALEYVLSDLYKIDKEMYINIYNTLDSQARKDIKEHREYTNRYESLGILRFFDGLNTAHGAVWDGDAQRAYSSTAKKIVHYLKNNQNPV